MITSNLKNCNTSLSYVEQPCKSGTSFSPRKVMQDKLPFRVITTARL